MSQQIFSAIPLIMAEVGAIPKKRENKQGSGYMFRGIDDVMTALQPVLSKHGVFFTPEVLSEAREERASKSGGTLIYTVLKVKYNLYASDGSTVSVTTVGEAMDSGDKSANKAMSAALKYALLQLFCIPTEEDNDTENHSPEPTPRALQSYPRAPAPVSQGPKPVIPNPFVKPSYDEPDVDVGPSSCTLCGSDLLKSAKTGGLYCPNFKDKTRGNHTYVG